MSSASGVNTEFEVTFPPGLAKCLSLTMFRPFILVTSVASCQRGLFFPTGGALGTGTLLVIVVLLFGYTHTVGLEASGAEFGGRSLWIGTPIGLLKPEAALDPPPPTSGWWLRGCWGGVGKEVMNSSAEVDEDTPLPTELRLGLCCV